LNVLIVNTHSALNSGDLAITIAEVQLLRRCLPIQRIAVTSRTPQIDARVLAPMGVSVLPPLVPAPSVFGEGVQKISGTIRNMAGIGSKRDLWRTARASDLIISSGGGYFWSNRTVFPGPMFFQNYLHVRLAGVLRKPIVFFPQSFGPLYAPLVTRMLRAALSDPNVVRVFSREQISVDFLRRLLQDRPTVDRIALCPDAAFCLEARADVTPLAAVSSLPRPVVAVTVRPWDFPDAGSRSERKGQHYAYLTGLVTACRNLHERWHGSVLVFPQSRGPGSFEDDTVLSRTFCSMLRDEMPGGTVLLLPLSAAERPEAIIGIMSCVDLLIATRFHSAIFAFLAGTPAIAVSYQPKGKGIMQELGLARFAVDISAVDSEQITALGNEILENHHDYSSLVRDAVDRLRKTAVDCLSDALIGYERVRHNEGPARQ
jgi:colanic acid/amylovoran biosynthesis protein